MTNIKAPFNRDEYDHRLSKTRAAMANAGLDALFVTDPSNQAWLTGYDGWSFYVHQGVILTMEGEPIWWGRYMDMLGGRRTCWMDHSNILGYGDHFIQSTVVHPMQDLAEQLQSRGFGAARIGVEMENYYYSAKAHAVLTAELPNAMVLDATALAFVIFAGTQEFSAFATVTASTFGLVTIVLARFFLKEPMTGKQWTGALLVFASVCILSI